MFNKLFNSMYFKDNMDRLKIQTLFDEYMDNLPDNFYKNQFELAKEYGASYEDWVRILSHPAFDTWKAEQIALIAKTTTDKALAGGSDLADKNALPLLKTRMDVLKDERKSEKPTIIVIPESLFFKGDGEA